MQPSETSNILGAFALPERDYQLQELKQRLINNTYLVLHKVCPEFILQNINPKVFREIHTLMGNFQ